VCQRLMQMPGIGPMIAYTFTAYVDDPTQGRRRRRRARHLCARHRPTPRRTPRRRARPNPFRALHREPRAKPVPNHGPWRCSNGDDRDVAAQTELKLGHLVDCEYGLPADPQLRPMSANSRVRERATTYGLGASNRRRKFNESCRSGTRPSLTSRPLHSRRRTHERRRRDQKAPLRDHPTPIVERESSRGADECRFHDCLARWPAVLAPSCAGGSRDRGRRGGHLGALR